MDDAKNGWPAVAVSAVLMLFIWFYYFMQHDGVNAPAAVMLLCLASALAAVAVYPGNGKHLAGFNAMSDEELSGYDMTLLSHRAGIGFNITGYAVLVTGMICGSREVGSWTMILAAVVVFIVVMLITLTWASVSAKKAAGR